MRLHLRYALIVIWHDIFLSPDAIVAAQGYMPSGRALVTGILLSRMQEWSVVLVLSEIKLDEVLRLYDCDSSWPALSCVWLEANFKKGEMRDIGLC